MPQPSLQTSKHLQHTTITRDGLNSEVEAYLARGGTVTRIPSADEVRRNPMIWVSRQSQRVNHAGPTKQRAYEENLTVARVLEKYTAGPVDGVFTDGSAEPNPGPGGWGVVYVVGGQIVAEQCGHDPRTTNNRMELTALIAACKMVPQDQKAIIHTDSELCVNSITIWAKDWEARGWKKKAKKGGAIKNLDLVQELYALYHGHPGLEMKWIRAHSGKRWNEYADSLATAYRRSDK